MKITATGFLVIAASACFGQFPCPSELDLMDAAMAKLNLPDGSFSGGTKLTSFQKDKAAFLVLAGNSRKCLNELKPKPLGLIATIDRIIDSLNQFSDTTSKGDPTLIKYNNYKALAQNYLAEKQVWLSQLLFEETRSSINTMIDGVKRDLDTAIGKVNQSVTLLNGEIQGIKTDLDTSLNNRTSPIQAKVNLIPDYGPWYAGISVATVDGIGFTLQRHFHPFTATNWFYIVGAAGYARKAEQGSMMEGASLAVGPAFVIANEKGRIALLLEGNIFKEPELGLRMMAYNRSMAVGIGYSDYMGPSVSLLIGF